MSCSRCGREHSGACVAATLALPEVMASSPSQAGMTVGHYRLIRELGRGSMGVVYLAENPVIGSRVAVKVMRHELLAHPEMTRRFLAEARACSAVRHPNTLQVFDLVTLHDGRPCLVMELLEGQTLEQRLRLRQLEPAEAVEILGQVCDALEAAHAAGVVHRDIKAENVFLAARPGRPEQVKVLDFGIARLAQEAGMTAPGMVLGTPDYMAPEQVLGQPVDGRSDLFAVGVLAYRLLAGRLPWSEATARDAMMARVEKPPPEPGFGEPLRSAVLRALQRDPALRFQTAAELGQALREGAAQTSTWQLPSPPEMSAAAPVSGQTAAALLLAELEPTSGHYALLGVAPDAEMAQLRAALERRAGELEAAGRGAGGEQRGRLEVLSQRLARARTELGDPAARARHDGFSGNYQGVARALFAGMLTGQLEALHAEYAARFPDKVQLASEVGRAAELCVQMHELPRALAMLEHALQNDPLERSLHDRFWALKRDCGQGKSAG